MEGGRGRGAEEGVWKGRGEEVIIFLYIFLYIYIAIVSGRNGKHVLERFPLDPFWATIPLVFAKMPERDYPNRLPT